MVKSVPQTPEFSRLVQVDRVGPAGLDIDIEATEAERAALARRFGLVTLDRLVAKARVAMARAGLYRVDGRFEAEIVQSCVVSLAPVSAHLLEAFSLAFDQSAPVDIGAIDLSANAPEPPEPLRGGTIDLGEAVSQQLAVALDPYPRAPGAKIELGAEKERRDSPFAVLAALRNRR